MNELNIYFFMLKLIIYWVFLINYWVVGISFYKFFFVLFLFSWDEDMV